MAAIDDLIKQILGQNTTAKWTGEGYGGAEANAKAMAKLLADAGITDIKQFGKIDKYEPVEVTGYSLNGNTVQNPSKGVFYEQIPQYDGEGGIQGYQTRYLSPQEAAQVKPQYGIVEFDSDGGRSVRPVTNVVEKNGQLLGVTGQTYGNKVTGQAIESGTGRWQRQGGEDLFGGTGEGKGNTGFRVQMSPDGTPVFYTTQGSSSDLADIMPIVQLGLMATGAGGLLGNALLGAGANQVAAGALGGALLGGGTAALSGQDVLKGALLGGAGGALSGYLNPATGEISSTPTEGAIPLTGEELSGLGANTAGYYDEINDIFVPDVNGGLQGPLTNATSGTNIGSMAGYDYDPISGNWTMPDGEIVNTLVTENPVTNGGDIMRNAGAMPVSPVAEKVAETSKSPLSVSDTIRLAGIGATLAGGAKLASGGGSGGYDIVPIPSDWTSPIKPTGVAEFTPLAPIDFGNKEMLRGTQWEQLLSPDYGKAPAMPSMPTNPSNMDFNQLMGILGNTRTSIPTQSVSINDVIAGIQSQYGQTPTSSMG